LQGLQEATVELAPDRAGELLLTLMCWLG
jgi:hypothetical protein